MQDRVKAMGEDGDHPTFCRICEACCGMVAKVEGGRITSIVADRDNPHSQGHVCLKGTTFARMVYDPDRVTRPLKQVGGPGEFEPVSWDEALADIAQRLAAIRERDGADAIAAYLGNPTAFATDTVMSHGGLMRALGSRKSYGAGSQDSNSRTVANFIAYGAAMTNSFPDLPHCDFLLVLGANLLVSNGSVLYSPRVRHDLDAIVARGRVVVVDPRLTETARRYEHLPIRPNGDIWLLLSLLRVLSAEGLIDRDHVGAQAIGLERLEAELQRVDIGVAAARCGVSEAAICELARDFATTPRAAVYSRLGLCRGPYATLANFLVTALNIVGGKFGNRGGAIFGHTLLAGTEKGSFGGYGETRSRIGGMPSVAKYLPSVSMPADILEPGEGRVRALLVTAGNPVLSAPGGSELERALEDLELLVAFDVYVNETSRYAHYVLPGTTFLERADVPFLGMNMLMRPFVHYTDAVIPPVGEARHEHQVYREIVIRMGLTWPTRSEREREDAEQGIVWTPLDRVDDMLRRGPAGDAYGAHVGWSFERLRRHPHGVMVDLPDPTHGWAEKLGYPDRKLRLWHELLESEFMRLWSDLSAAPKLALIGRRDIRSINSWLHNVDRLVRSQHPRLLISAKDAAERGIEDGDVARLWNGRGEVTVEAAVSDEVEAGVVCYPHGWGHAGGWRTANAQPGANINLLLGLGVEAAEFVSGTTLMDGIEVFVERYPTPVRASHGAAAMERTDAEGLGVR